MAKDFFDLKKGDKIYGYCPAELQLLVIEVVLIDDYEECRYIGTTYSDFEVYVDEEYNGEFLAEEDTENPVYFFIEREAAKKHLCEAIENQIERMKLLLSQAQSDVVETHAVADIWK
jgi:hypothetical protein